MYECLAKRRSVRRFRDEPVPDAVLERIATAVTVAPSAHHTAPWHVTIVTDRQRIATLTAAMGAAWDRDLTAEGVPAPKRQRLLERSRERFTGAPALILMSLDERILPGPDQPRARFEEIMMTQSVAAAIYAVLLAAAYEGLGAAWHSAPLFCPDVVRQALGLPPHVRSQALITVGHPADDPGPRPERSLAGALTWVRATDEPAPGPGTAAPAPGPDTAAPRPGTGGETT